MTRTTGPVLALVPGTRTAPGTGANTGPCIHPELADERVFAGLHSAGYDAWLDHVWHAAACTRPIRLRGDIKHIDPATGELLRTIPTIGMPDGVDLQAVREPARHHLPRLRRDLPPRRLPPHPRRAHRRQRRHPGRRHPPRRVRHLHRPVLRPGPRPPGPPAHLPGQVPLPLPAPALPRPPRRRHVRARPPRRLLHPARPRRSPARPAAVPGLLRLRRPRGVEQPAQANYGGAPSKPSNATSASSPAAAACPRSGFPAATANTA